MKLALKIQLVIMLLIRGVHLTPVDFKGDAKRPEKDSVNQGCSYKNVGSQGSIYSPYISKQNVTCEWKIDVTKGFVAVLEFELLRLPVISERSCETYIEISYGTQEDPVKRKICPTDKIDRIRTDSQVAIVRFHAGALLKESGDTQFGFKINFSAATITVTKSMFTGNYAVMILLLSMATMCVIAVCLFCFRCRLNGRHPPPAPDEPNVPTRQQLQETFEFQRSALQAERRKMSFSIFQSQGSSFSSNLARWASNPHLPSAAAHRVPQSEGRAASIMTTPRSVFPELRRKWSEDSVKRIAHLRTKLVARFSSASSNNTSSDISVFFPASERRSTYSQLNCEEDNEQQIDVQAREKLQQPTNREMRTASSSSRKIPAIVIEFVE